MPGELSVARGKGAPFRPHRSKTLPPPQKSLRLLRSNAGAAGADPRQRTMSMMPSNAVEAVDEVG